MRFHVVNLPHTNVTAEYSWCAYTQKVRRFCDMMFSLGHEVFLYAGSETDAKVTELVSVSEEVRPADVQFNPPIWEGWDPFWMHMNNRAALEMGLRGVGPEDFICLIAGRAQARVSTAYPDNLAVEYGVGYEGIWAPYRVFESYAWMHSIYSQVYGSPFASNGSFWDAVIPNSYHPEEFPKGEGGDYLLYIGRLTERKGVQIALDVAKQTKKKLILAGQGEYAPWADVPNIEYVGLVGPERRAELMGGALMTFVPTIYVEPFGGVAVESMMCGTPVATTDWGAFPETVKHGDTGFRCHTLKDFLDAVEGASDLDRQLIRNYAMLNYSTDTIKYQYEDYFKRLLTLKSGRGWYET